MARPEPQPYPEAQLSRCGVCGQWSWAGSCTLHPEAVATYGGDA
jgi:hypothetical protein